LKKRTIAFFLPSVQGGGAERITINLIDGLLGKGYNVDLVLVDAKGSYLNQVHKDCRIIDLKAGRVAASLFKLKKYLQSVKPNVMISGLNHANVIAILAHKFAQVPTRLVVIEHNNLSQTVIHSRTIRARIIPHFMRVFYPKADAIVAVSQGVADDLNKIIKIPKENIKVIYNPIINDHVLISSGKPVDHEWFNENCPPVILSVGRLNKQKDYGTLLKAFSIVRKDIDCRLLILGEGEERGTLEKLAKELGIEDDFSMPGFTANPYQYMSKAKLFVLSSIYEGLPTVLVEAIACGAKVISTDCPSGPREINEICGGCTLVPVGDVYLLAKAIKEALENVEKANITASVEPFTLDYSVTKYAELIEQLCNNRFVN